MTANYVVIVENSGVFFECSRCDEVQEIFGLPRPVSMAEHGGIFQRAVAAIAKSHVCPPWVAR